MPLFGKPDVGKLEGQRDIRGLIKTLKHRDERIRNEAAEALGRMGQQAIAPLVDELRRLAPTQKVGWEAMALARVGEPAIEPLIRMQAEAARAGNALLLAYGAIVSGQVLRAIGEPAVKPLIGMLSDTDANVRGLVSSALGGMGGQAVPQLVAALTDTEDQVRIGAAVALALAPDQTAVEPLRTALQDPSNWVRVHAAGALAKMDAAEAQALQLLREAAQDFGPGSSEDYRGVAAFYLQQCGQKP